ncbi:MAG: sodium:calcium antiporter [Candidatus Desulfofervidaceae bacterium]|nr:sodium:calcium antiporter [Candidatus Desulfofervidaceae bacterium]
MWLLLFLWFQFFFCSALIFIAGIKLSFYADVIAEKTGLGKSWIGMLMLAPVTSLPELFNGLSAILYVRAPDLAVGDILGSCVFNLLILCFLDVFSGRLPLTSRINAHHTFAAGFGIIMLALVGMGITSTTSMPHWKWIGISSPILICLYIVGMKIFYKTDKKTVSNETNSSYTDISLSSSLQKFSLSALVIVIAATWLPKVGAALATATGLGQTFIGSILIAFSTSLPEVVVSLSALRLGNVDMAVSNLVGSNLINLCLLAIYDVLFLAGPLLAFVHKNQLINVFSAIMMASIFISELNLHPRKKILFLSFGSWAIISVYLLNLGVLYYLK